MFTAKIKITTKGRIQLIKNFRALGRLGIVPEPSDFWVKSYNLGLTVTLCLELTRLELIRYYFWCKFYKLKPKHLYKNREMIIRFRGRES